MDKNTIEVDWFHNTVVMVNILAFALPTQQILQCFTNMICDI